jgi:hypothetical protein
MRAQHSQLWPVCWPRPASTSKPPPWRLRPRLSLVLSPTRTAELWRWRRWPRCWPGLGTTSGPRKSPTPFPTWTREQRHWQRQQGTSPRRPHRAGSPVASFITDPSGRAQALVATGWALAARGDTKQARHMASAACAVGRWTIAVRRMLSLEPSAIRVLTDARNMRSTYKMASTMRWRGCRPDGPALPAGPPMPLIQSPTWLSLACRRQVKTDPGAATEF